MAIETILTDFKINKYKIINKEELQEFISSSQLIKEVDTHLSDFIRILEYNNEIFIQEMSNKNEIIIRKMFSLEQAEQFIKERLDFYDRKWDGCGCKINYYE